jgi:site-specific recombinase XerD
VTDRLPLQTLVDQVLATRVQQQYAETTVTAYRRFYQRLVRYAEAQGAPPYTDTLGDQFLTTLGIAPAADAGSGTLPPWTPSHRYLAVLSDYQRHGTLVRRRAVRPSAGLPEPYQALWAAFGADCDHRGYAPKAGRTRQSRIRFFLGYCAAQGLTVDALTPEHLSRYTATLLAYHPKTVAVMLSTLRLFLRFCHRAGYHPQDLSAAVPRMRVDRYTRVPRAWPADAVARILGVVDRANPTGKRDDAMLLLAARLGLRIGDIATLTLAALHWETKTMTWTQQKTGRSMTYPLLDDVGWALIDYLQHGRPPTPSPVVFVRHRAPFEPFGPASNLHALVMRYARRAGIPIPTGPHGFHALRHRLASTLLDHDTPLPVIAAILGHASTQSTQAYLQIDEARLAQCPLNPEEVWADDPA